MSQQYEVWFGITEYDTAQLAAIKKVIMNLDADIHADSFVEEEGALSLLETRISIHEEPEAFSDRIMAAIWVANGKYCHIEMQLQYINPEDFFDFVSDDEKYAELMQESAT